jgi:hypothetical protein
MKVQVGAIVVALVALSAGPGYAQSISGGVKVGANVATLSVDNDDDDIDFKNRTGVVAGGFIDIGLTERISVQPEVLFAQKGAKADFDEGDLKIKLDFVEIPVLLKVNFSGATVRPFVVVGPGFGFRTTAKQEFAGQEEDFKDDTESIDVSAIVGIGVQVGPAMVEARYDFGFRDLSKDEIEARTRTFSIVAGIGFGKR